MLARISGDTDVDMHAHREVMIVMRGNRLRKGDSHPLASHVYTHMKAEVHANAYTHDYTHSSKHALA